MPETASLREAIATLGTEAGQEQRPGRLRIRLIEGDRQGSSGYYPADMLKRDGPKVFGKGTHLYVNHPTISEDVERPERSVYDLAGALTTDARYEGDGLYAEVELAPHHRWIEGVKDMIGMSIRASGTVEPSSVESIRGPVVTSLTHAESVDFVTAAGAGGKIVALLESARQHIAAEQAAKDVVPIAEARNVAQWLESRIHLMFTQIADDLYGDGCLTRDERIALSSAIGDGLTAFTTRVEADQPQLYQRDRWDGPPEGDAEISETAPKNPGDIATVTENEPGTQPADNPKEGTVPELTEDQKRQLAEAATMRADLEAANALLAEAGATQTELDDTKRQLAEANTKVAETAAVAARVTELETKLAEAAAHNLRMENDRVARTLCAEALKSSTLPEFAHSRVTESVVRDLPTTDGVVDTAKLAEAITAAIESESAYVAALAESSGAGTPRGLGAGTKTDAEPLSADDFTTKIAESFQRLGMTPDAAKLAATGRR